MSDSPPGGNGNGRFDPGEDGKVLTRVRNYGTETAQALTGKLRSTNPLFVITDSTSAYGDLAPGAEVTNTTDPYAAHADARIEPGTVVTCTLHLRSENWAHDWAYVMNFRVGEPPIPPGQVIWGPKTCSSMPTTYGLYGVAYNPTDNLIYCCNYMQPLVYKYSSDSLLTAQGTIPAPEDSCTDIDYCAYDGNFWILANPSRKVYKVSPNGTVIRSFNTTFADYPVGVVEHDDEHKVYISDRRGPGVLPMRIFVTDTSGNLLATMPHPLTGNYGTRCLALDYRTSTSPPSLLNMFTWFNAGGTAVDSCCMYEMDRSTATVLNSYRFPNSGWNMRGIEFDPRDGSYWVTIMQGGTTNNQILKVAGFHYGSVGQAERTGLSPGPGIPVRVKPNPFTGSTALEFELGRPGAVSVEVFNNNGRLVRGLMSRQRANSRVSITWDGLDDSGRYVPAGVYFFRLAADQDETWQKVVRSR